MMLGKEQLPLVSAEPITDLPGGVQLFLHPERSGLEELPKAAGRDREIGLQNPLEFEQGLIVEPDMAHIGQGDARFSEAVLDCLRGKAWISLLPGKSFLLCRCQDLAIAKQASCAVMIEGGDPEGPAWRHAVMLSGGWIEAAEV